MLLQQTVYKVWVKQVHTYFTGGSFSFLFNLSISSYGKIRFCKLAALIHLGRYLFPINAYTLSLIGPGDSLGYLCKKNSHKDISSTYCPKKDNLEWPDLTCRALVLSQLGYWKAKYSKVSKCFAGLSSPKFSEGSRGYPRACLTSSKYSSIHVLSALLRREEGKQELSKGKALRDNCGLLRNLSANFLSSNGGFSMNLFGGAFFFGVTTFFRSWSSLSSLRGLFWGSSLESATTAKILKFEGLGVDILGSLSWIREGNGESEAEKEISNTWWGKLGFDRGLRVEEISISVKEYATTSNPFRAQIYSRCRKSEGHFNGGFLQGFCWWLKCLGF